MSKPIKVSIISDTHTKHNQIENDLEVGDIIIHAGDFSSMGYKHECENFIKWFSSLNYRYKIFICGNHELGVERDDQMLKDIVEKYCSPVYKDLIYLNEESVEIMGLKIFGSAWSPWFYDWAYNAQRGEEIAKHWNLIPNDIDILITHGPPQGILDKVEGRPECLGCEDLYNKVGEVNPMIHTFGHIHSGYGHYKGIQGTHYFNASQLNEQYQYTNKPWNIIINEDKEIEIL